MTQFLTPQVVVRQPNQALQWNMYDTEAELSDVTTAGYLTPQQLLGQDFQPQDVFYVKYVGGAGFFLPTFDGTEITLTAAAVGSTSVTYSGSLIDGNLLQNSGTSGLQVDSGFAPTGIPLVASVAITAAQFNGMYAAPKLLIAAPGANKLIVVNKMDLIMTYGAAAFASGGVVAAQYDSTVHGGGVLATNSEAAADFFASASTTFQFAGVSGNTVGILPFATTVNKGLYLSNATGAFTTGDSTFVAKIFYHIVATA